MLPTLEDVFLKLTGHSIRPISNGAHTHDCADCWKLTWLEIKIFVREPLGSFGTVGDPGAGLRGLGRMFGRPADVAAASRSGRSCAVELPVLRGAAHALSAVLSLVTHRDLSRRRHPQAAARDAAAAADDSDRPRAREAAVHGGRR